VETNTWNLVIKKSLDEINTMFNRHQIPCISFYGDMKDCQNYAYNAELMGIYQAIKFLSFNKYFKLNISSDCKSIVSMFDHQMTLTKKDINTILRTNGYPYWEAIRKLNKDRVSKINLKWERGHQIENVGNDYADFLASHHGSNENESTNHFTLPDIDQGDIINSIPKCQDMTVETDIRKFFRHLGQHKSFIDFTKLAWNTKNSNIYNNDDFQHGMCHMVDWPKTLSILHGGHKPTSTFTRDWITHNRTYFMKLNSGTLPTMELMYQRMPHLYPNAICKVCLEEVETNTHIWNCVKSQDLIKAIFIKEKHSLLKTIQLKLHPLHLPVEVFKLISKRLSLFTFFKENDDLNNIKRDASEFLHEYAPDRSDRHIAKVITIMSTIDRSHLIRGTVLKSISEYITIILEAINTDIQDRDKKHIQSLIKRIPYYIGNLTNAIAVECRQQVWINRCNLTIDWETEHHITYTQKRTKLPPPVIDSDVVEENPIPQRPKQRKKRTSKIDNTKKRSKAYRDIASDFLVQYKGANPTHVLCNPNIKLKLSKYKHVVEIRKKAIEPP